MHIEPGLYPSIVDKVVAKKTYRRTKTRKQFKFQKIKVHKTLPSIYLRINQFIIQRAELSQIFGCDLEKTRQGYIERKRSTLSL